VANHLTPTELAEELNMKRREVISKCMEMGVPIFNGRIDRSLFITNLRTLGERRKGATAI
jgi:translation initiation factor IF-2-like protein